MKFRFLSATKEGKLQFFERVIQFFLSHSYLLLGNCPAPWSTRARVAIMRININTFRHFSRLVFSSFPLPRECACRHSPPSFVYKWHRLSASSANFSNRRVKGYTRCSRRWICQITGEEPHRPLPFPFSFFCVLSSPPPLLLSLPPPPFFFELRSFPLFVAPCHFSPLFSATRLGRKSRLNIDKACSSALLCSRVSLERFEHFRLTLCRDEKIVFDRLVEVCVIVTLYVSSLK